MASIQEVVKIIKSLSKSDRALLLEMLADTSESKAESGFNSIKSKAACPHCHSNHVVRNGFRGEIQRFICKGCKKSFTSRTNTITEHSKKNYTIWRKYLECMMNGFTVRRNAEICSINKDTAFIWRHKVLDALQNMQSEVKLNGIVEADETFFALSFKGNHKKSTAFVMPRKAHKRGNDVHTRGLSHEQVCVPCGVNGNGLSIARVANLGRVGTKDLEFTFKNQISKDSVLCCDGTNAYKKFADGKSLDLVQLKSGKSKNGNLHVQHINAYHSVLKTWITRFHGVATKYLDNYLVWHNFVNWAKAPYEKKSEILSAFVFCTNKTVKSKEISLRRAIPVNI